MSIFSEILAILHALLTFDSFEISPTLGGKGAWVLGFMVTVLGGYIIARLYQKLTWLSTHLERSIMVSAYLIIAAIIFVEVIRRFVFNVQAPWSTTLPPYLFLIMAWAGCAYNVHTRTHLNFSETRAKLSRPHQMFWLTMDALLWVGFSWVVLVTSTRVTVNSAANFQILLGTDNVLQWWLLISVPISFLLIAGRAIQNWLEDVKNYREGEPLITQHSLAGD